MEQSVYYVNCPHCGQIIEAICPRISQTPRKVQADDTSLSFVSETTKVGCQCGKKMIVNWFF